MARPRGVDETVVSDARATILGRVDRALKTGRIPDGDPKRVALHAPALHAPAHVSPTDIGRPFQGRQIGDAESVTLQDRFVTEARALGVDTFVETSSDAVRARLASLIEGQRVLAWNPDQLPYGAGALVAGAALGSSPRDEQANAQVGVTGCHGAIAETGSLALLSKPGCSRAVSLLPPLHIAIVRPEDFFFGMGEFFEARKDQIAAASNCTFVTGPSRTADIELTLTIGVHGPARVVVILGPDGGNGSGARGGNEPDRFS